MDGNLGTLMAMGDTGGGDGGGGNNGPVNENDYSEYADTNADNHQDEQLQQDNHQDQQQQQHDDHQNDAMDDMNNDEHNDHQENSLNNMSNNSNSDMQNVAQKRQASDYDSYSNSSSNKYQKRQKTGYNNYNSGGGGGHFQNRAGKIDLRILLPSKDAGAIIGRGGSNIKKLRLEHKTIIQVPDCDGPERLLLIGGETDAAINTILDIIPLLEDNQFNNGPNDGSTELRLLVHQSQAGCVIGRNGDKIKDLRVKHNLDMKVYSECAPQSTERICQMKGKPHDIVQCLKEVLSLLDTAPPKGMIRPYDPHNHNEFLSSQYGGYISDKRAPGGPGGRMNSGGGGGAGATGGSNNFNSDRNSNQGGNRGGFNNNSYDGNTNDNRSRSNMRGAGHSRGNDRESRAGSAGGGSSGNNYRSSSNSNSRGGGGGGFGRGGGGDRGNDNRRGGGQRNSGIDGGGRGGRTFNNDGKNFNNNNNNNQQYGRQNNNGNSSNGSGYGNSNSGGGSMSFSNQANNNSSSSNNAGISTNQVTIPNDLAGAIIGPKGQKIQQIREQSGAGITIDKPVPGTTDRIITIQGTPEQIQNAQYLLQLTVKQSGLWQGQ